MPLILALSLTLGDNSAEHAAFTSEAAPTVLTGFKSMLHGVCQFACAHQLQAYRNAVEDAMPR